MAERGAQVSRRTALLSIAALAGGYLVGCGGDDDDEEAGGETTASEEPTPPPTTESDATPVPTPTAPASISVFEAAASWTQLGASGPSPRRDHSLVATADGGTVYLFGGRDDSGPLGDAWLYDVAGDSWTQLEGGPAARFGHNAVFDTGGGRIILFGGQGAEGFFNDTWSFDGQNWQELTIGGPPSPRYGAGAAHDEASGGVYISHGFTDSGRFDDTWRLPLEGDAWGDESPASGPRPVRRCLLRMALDPRSGRIFLFGGQTDGIPFLGDLWSFDPAANAWTELAVAGPSARNLYSMVAVDQPAALLFGGRSEAGALNDIWVLDFLSDSWLQLAAAAEPPAARSGHDAAWLPVRNAMVMFGGRDGAQNLLGDSWLLSFS
jgi:hypothetical protein